MTTTFELQQIRSNNGNDDLPLFALPVVGQTERPLLAGITERQAGTPKISITYFETMAVEACRRKSTISRSFVAWLIARAIDEKGQGDIPRDELKKTLFELGVKPATAYRWIKQAVNNGYLTPSTRKTVKVYRIAGVVKVAQALGLSHVGRRYTIDAAALIGTGYRARLTSALTDNRMMSRERIQKTYNIPASTQALRDKQAKQIRIHNFEDTGKQVPKEQAKHYKEFITAPLFIMGDGRIVRRLPDYRKSIHAYKAKRGSTRNINKELTCIDNSLFPQRVSNITRLFFETNAQYSRALEAKDFDFSVDRFMFKGQVRDGLNMWAKV